MSQDGLFLGLFRCLHGFFVEIDIHLVVGGGGGVDAVLGNVGAGDPGDGVEAGFPEVIISPVVVEMSTGEAEAAAAIFAFDDPDDVLREFIGDHFPDFGVSGVVAIGAFHGFIGRDGGEDGGDTFHVFGEAHVKIPFIEHFKRVNAAANAGELRENPSTPERTIPAVAG